jgi:hypothetical protein
VADPTPIDIEKLMIAALRLSGVDRYNHAHDESVRTAQDYRPRCFRDCRCFACRVWRGMAKALLTEAIVRLQEERDCGRQL